MKGWLGMWQDNVKTKKQNIDDFEKLHCRDDWNKRPNYTQACQFTTYIINRFGKIKLLQFLKNIPKNNGTRESFTEFSEFFATYFNVDFEKIVNEWQKNATQKIL